MYKYLLIFLITFASSYSYQMIFPITETENYFIDDKEITLEDPSFRNKELITEDRLKEIIEAAKSAPLPEENVDTHKKQFLTIHDSFADKTDIKLLHDIESTFDKYNFSTKSQDIHVGRINANEFTSDRIIDNGEVGVGISYKENENNKHLERKKDDSEDWNYTPVYATGKYKISEGEDNVKYLKVNLGYSFKELKKDERKDKDDRIQGGIYYGVGGGVDYRDMSVGLMYQVNKDGIENNKMHKDDSRVTFSVDYKLGE